MFIHEVERREKVKAAWSSLGRRVLAVFEPTHTTTMTTTTESFFFFFFWKLLDSACILKRILK